MKHLLALIGLMPLLLYAQTDEPMPCGTPDGELIKLLQDYGESSLTNGDSVGVLMVKIYVLSNSLLRPYPHLEQQLIESIDEANQFFQGSGIQFALCGEPEYVDSIHYNGTGYHDWLHQHVDPRFINIMSASIPYVCGVANLGGTGGFSNTGIVCNNGEVVSHEFGHLFGLYHTFSFVPGTNMTGELVDGSNCDTTGDGICDTSADPFPHGGYLDSCAYVGAVTDSNGQLYDPPINNLMSYYNYAFHGCGTEAFTEGQFERMRGILHQDLFHLMKLPYGMSLPEISGAPSYICVGDSTTFSLSANPPGGVFSGDGISGDSLFLGDLPVGSYEITYELPPAQPVTPYSKTDYIQFVYGYGSGPDTNVWWQSFRAGETAMMEALRLRARATIDEPFQWTIYAGIGVQGAQLYHQADTFTASDALRWRRFSLDSLFQQTGDSVYTLAFWADSSTTMQVDMANAYGAPFQLPGSISGLLGPGPSTINYHPCFATEIRSTTPLCNEPLRKHIHIIEPLDTDYTI
ncbi:MAG: M43 family zinc metalloprotease, partial [Bacteroidota bacterium]